MGPDRNIARTGRALGIITDARYRFERGVDPEFMVPGVELATRLVLDFCGGTPTEIEVAGYAGHKPKIVSFPLSEVKRLTGIEVPKARKPRHPRPASASSRRARATSSR